MRIPAAAPATPPRAGTRLALTVALLLALLLAALPAPAPVAAYGCTVTSTADSGGGSLRGALALLGCDTINFNLPGSAPWTINLQSTLPTIARPLTITGPGQGNLTIRPDPSIATASRFLLLFVDAHNAPGTPGMAVNISGLTLAGGRAKPQLGANYGGNLRSYRATLTLTDVTLKDATGAADSGGAGAYFNSGAVTMTRVTVSGNSAPGSVTYGTGAGLFIDEFYGNTSVNLIDSTIVGNVAIANSGGGIALVRDSGTLTNILSVVLTNTVVGTAAAPNRADSGGGGGILNVGGALTLTNSTVSGNTAASNGGGLHVYNGGYTSGSASATLTNSVVSGNTTTGGGNGGGLYAITSGNSVSGSVSVTLSTSVVSGNTTVNGDGGGLYVNNSGSNGATAGVTQTNSAVSGNTAVGGSGGGLRVVNTSATLTNVTISGNRAGYDGGGLSVSANNSSVSATATLRFVTITGNTANQNNDATGDGGGLARSTSGGGTATLAVLSSIVAGNRRGTAAPVPSDCFNLFSSSSLGRNLWGDQAACPNNGAVGDQNLAALNVPIGSVLNTALANNGGPTQTHALVAGSPAIDKGDNVTCANALPGGPGGADQRGVARPQGAGCDVGAVEYVPPAPTVALAVQTVGSGTVARVPQGTGSGPFTYNVGTLVTLTPQPAANQTFVGWTVDGVPQGWPSPLTLTMNTAHTVVATFAPTAAFPDVDSGRADFAAISALASRGTIKGYQDGRYGPDDRVRRDQMAALIARAMPAGPGTPPQTLVPPACLVAGSWDCEVWGNNFSDGAGINPDLWRNAGTMQHYGVSIGYSGATCAAKQVPSPCFGPGDNVTYAQTISFITRAMKAKGYWADQPGAPLPYSDVPTAHQLDVRTFHFYTSSLGGVPSAPTTTAGWEAGATRGWFARALWAALDSYWKVERVP